MENNVVSLDELKDKKLSKQDESNLEYYLRYGIPEKSIEDEIEKGKGENPEYTDSEKWEKEIEGRVEIELFLKRLSVRQREIVSLKMEGYNQTEIAEKLGINRKTIEREMSLIRDLCAKMNIEE